MCLLWSVAKTLDAENSDLKEGQFGTWLRAGSVRIGRQEEKKDKFHGDGLIEKEERSTREAEGILRVTNKGMLSLKDNNTDVVKATGVTKRDKDCIHKGMDQGREQVESSDREDKLEKMLLDEGTEEDKENYERVGFRSRDGIRTEQSEGGMAMRDGEGRPVLKDLEQNKVVTV